MKILSVWKDHYCNRIRENFQCQQCLSEDRIDPYVGCGKWNSCLWRGKVRINTNIRGVLWRFYPSTMYSLALLSEYYLVIKFLGFQCCTLSFSSYMYLHTCLVSIFSLPSSECLWQGRHSSVPPSNSASGRYFCQGAIDHRWLCLTFFKCIWPNIFSYVLMLYSFSFYFKGS